MLRWIRTISTYFSVGLFLCSIGIVLYVRYQQRNIPEQSILHITLDGQLQEQPIHSWQKMLLGQSNVNIRTLTRAIRSAANDPRIVGAVFDIQQPSFGLAQIQELASAMQDFQQSGKWNVAYVDTVGEGLPANGAYALATQANQILLAPCGDVLLSGLKAETPFYADMLKRLKVGVYVERRAEYKNFANTYTESGYTPPHKEALSHVFLDLQQTIFQLVQQGRKQPEQTVQQWFSKGLFTAKAAQAAGLVDELLYWDEVVGQAEAKASKPEPFISLERYLPAIVQPEQRVEIAYVVGEGAIMRGSSSSPVPDEDGINANVMREALAQARQDKVKAVLVRINSPGGSYVASDMIRRELEQLRAADIPVVISMGNVAASGGYLIAQEAEHIVAQAGTITGSIGVISLALAFRQPMQQFLGITWDTYQTIPEGQDISFLDLPTPTQRLTMSQHVDAIYDTFLERVAKGRNLPIEKVAQVAKGRIWSGRQALEHGLVDSLGGIDTAIAYLHKRLDLAAEQTIVLKPYMAEPNPMELFKRFFQSQLGMQRLVQSLLGWLHQLSSVGPAPLAVQSPPVIPAL